ncbi:MAG: TIGR04024 family LLM class F420-dependent oxidoreductase, partial [Halobacteriaceae archaeon]
GTSIIPIYSRSPALIAQTAATLQELSDDRFRLGLGPSGPAVIENWHGMSFDQPLRRQRETIEIIKQIMTGSPVTYDGEIFDLDGFRLRCDPPNNPPPIDVAGMGQKSVELAGRFADGWHALLFTPDGFRDRLADFNRGIDLGNKNRADLMTTLIVVCCVHQDQNAAARLVRQHIGFYLGGMGPFYRDNLADQGYHDLAYDVYEKWQAGNREEALNRIPENILNSLAVYGTPDEARSRLEQFQSIEGVDQIAISFPRGASQETIERTIKAFGPRR